MRSCRKFWANHLDEVGLKEKRRNHTVWSKRQVKENHEVWSE